MRLHSGNRVRRGLARHKKLAIVGGTVVGLVASAGVAMAFVAATDSGGNVNGSLNYAGSATQPNTTSATVVWSGTSFSCKQADGTFTGTTTISSDGQTVSVGLPSTDPIYSDAVCTLYGNLQNTGNGDALITGFALDATGSQYFTSNIGVYQSYSYITPSSSSPYTLSAGASDSVEVVFAPNASLGNTAQAVTISGGLTFQPGPSTVQY